MWTHDFLPAKLSLLICRQGLQGILSEPVLGLMAAGSLGSHPHAVDVPGWVTPWGGGRPVYCGMFTSISGLCPLALPPTRCRSCDIRRCLSTLPTLPWEAKSLGCIEPLTLRSPHSVGRSCYSYSEPSKSRLQA